MLMNLCVLQSRQGQHEDDYADKARQQSGSSTSPFEETVIDDSLKFYSDFDMLVLIF